MGQTFKVDLLVLKVFLKKKFGTHFVVLGCHTRGGRLLFSGPGKVASTIRQWAPCPVVLDAYATDPKYRRTQKDN